MKRLFFTILLTVSGLCTFAQNDTVKQSKQMDASWLENVTKRFEFHGYAQGGYTFKNPEGVNSNTFDIKRSLFWVKAKITDRWSFLFMHDFNSKVQEFYTDYRFTKSKALSLRFGQWKNSYTLENPLSPTKLELIECYEQGTLFLTGCGSDPLYGVQYGRDLGMMLFGELFKSHLKYELALMNGQGIDIKDKNNKKDVIVKLEYLPVKNFRIVASAQKGTGCAVAESKYNPTIQIGDDYQRDRWSFGFEYKSKIDGVDYWTVRPLNIRAELVGGKDGDVNLFGGYATTSIPIAKTLDLVASYDYFNFNDQLDMKETNYVIGIQHWFYKSCRLQLQYTLCTPKAWAKDYSLLQAQVQFAF